MSALTGSLGFRYGFLTVGLFFVAVFLYSSVLAAGSIELSADTNSTLTDGQISVTVPKGSVSEALTLSTSANTVSSALPDGVTEGSTAFDLALSGDASFTDSVSIVVSYNDADIAAADNNPARLSIYKHDASFDKWFELNTKLDIIDKTITTQVTSGGSFTVGGKAAPPQSTPTPAATEEYKHPRWTPTPGAPTAIPTATALPPEPGDFAPGSGMLIGLLIAAVVLMSSGGYYLSQARGLK
jgi:hypothetical protein